MLPGQRLEEAVKARRGCVWTASVASWSSRDGRLGGLSGSWVSFWFLGVSLVLGWLPGPQEVVLQNLRRVKLCASRAQPNHYEPC